MATLTVSRKYLHTSSPRKSLKLGQRVTQSHQKLSCLILDHIKTLGQQLKITALPNVHTKHEKEGEQITVPLDMKTIVRVVSASE